MDGRRPCQQTPLPPLPHPPHLHYRCLPRRQGPHPALPPPQTDRHPPPPAPSTEVWQGSACVRATIVGAVMLQAQLQKGSGSDGGCQAARLLLAAEEFGGSNVLLRLGGKQQAASHACSLAPAAAPAPQTTINTMGRIVRSRTYTHIAVRGPHHTHTPCHCSQSRRWCLQVGGGAGPAAASSPSPECLPERSSRLPAGRRGCRWRRAGEERVQARRKESVGVWQAMVFV